MSKGVERWTEDAPDGVLIAHVLEGDEAALSLLYRRYVDAIYRFVLAQVRDHQGAEDLTSETFARMLNGLESFRGEASFKNWLYQIARNAVRNHRRAAGYRRTVSLSANLSETEDPLDRTVDPDQRDAVMRLLQPLPPRYRLVLELRFLQSCTIAETARRMNITTANAKVLQHRALKKAAQAAEENKLESRSAAR